MFFIKKDVFVVVEHLTKQEEKHFSSFPYKVCWQFEKAASCDVTKGNNTT